MMGMKLATSLISSRTELPDDQMNFLCWMKIRSCRGSSDIAWELLGKSIVLLRRTILVLLSL